MQAATEVDAVARRAALRAELAVLLPGATLSSDAARVAPRLTDNRGRFHGQALAVAQPDSVADVSRVLAWCSARCVAVVPQGGNTGNSGGATPDGSGEELLLCLDRLRRLRHIDADNFSLTAEAGCTLAEVQQAAEQAGRYFPLQLGSAASCQIGGVLATNAGGVHVLRFGMARDLALGVEVVLADGRVLEASRGLRKDNTGYDLKSLFIGSEGTLGVITAATLKLWPRVQSVATAWVALRDLDAALELLALLQSQGGERLSALELLPRAALQLLERHIEGCQLPLGLAVEWQALVEWTSPGEEPLADALQATLARALQQGLIVDAALAANAAQRAQFWRMRENITVAQGRAGPGLKHDISVPLSAVPAFLREAAAWADRAVPEGLLVAYGHAGDGNLHFNIHRVDGGDAKAFLARSEEIATLVYDLVEQYGGSISAEHGIGRLKVAELARRATPQKLATLRAIKQALDPLGIMNPGVLLTCAGTRGAVD